MKETDKIKEETIDMIPIAKLLGKNFLIPDYQRGYRWDKQQVNDMLNDIFEFMKKKFVKKENKDDEIYCLQPLVVSIQQDEEDTWRVVDGQQRLTTIYLILKYILKYINIENKELYTIKYQTRDRSQEFFKGLSSLTDENEAMKKAMENVDFMDNVDFYHIYIVYKAIEEWFGIHEECSKYVFGDILLNRVNVIWYCVNNEQETKIFTRLNIGKIPLTDSELIKAMFLNRNNYADGNADEVKSRQHKLANEWYAIENTLQNDEFWLFIHNRFYKKPTRIDFILELMCRNDHYEIKKTLGENSYQKLKKDEDELKNRLGTVCLKKFLNDKDYIKNLLKNRMTTVETEITNQIYNYIYDENGNCQKEDLKKALLKGTQKPENFENKTQEKKKEKLFDQFKKKMSDEKEKAALKKGFNDNDKYNLLVTLSKSLGILDDSLDKKEKSDNYYENKIKEIETKIANQIYDYIYDENENCINEDLKKFLLKGTQKQDNFENQTQEEKKEKLFYQFKNKLNKKENAALRVVIGNNDYTSLINKWISGLGEMIYDYFEYNTELSKPLLGVYEFDLMMNDEHGIYRYFDQVFKNKNSGQTVDKLWKDIKKFFDIFREWYNDYKLYHYIGFLVAAKKYDAENFINECVKLWQGKEADFEYKTALTISKMDKESFIKELKNEIVYKIMVDSNNNNPIDGKHNYFSDLINDEEIRKKIDTGSNNNFCDYLINTKFVENGYSKRCCVNILLLHNIETIIQYNDKLLDNNKYTVPYFTRFPFHLYNSDTWDVEHVRPNAGDDTNKEVQRLIYLILAKQYFANDSSKDKDLYEIINTYITETENLKIDYNKYSNDEIKDKIRNLKKELKINGDDTNKEAQSLIFLFLAKQYFADNLSEELEENIDNYIKETEILKIDYNKYSNDEIKDRIRNLEKELKIKGDYDIEKAKKEIENLENKDKRSDDEKERLEKLKDLYSLLYQSKRKEKFNEIRDEIDEIGGKALDYNDRNKIWNYTLLDSSTNREYSNHVYPYKRAYIAAKEKGEALKYTIDLVEAKNAEVDNNEIKVTKKNKDTEIYKFEEYYTTKNNEYYIVLKKETDEKAAPFVLQTTRNVFTKYYSDQITTMMQWTKEDAINYWEDMKEKLKFYFDELDKKLKEKLEENQKNKKHKE